jgi:hypothetical protein
LQRLDGRAGVAALRTVALGVQPFAAQKAGQPGRALAPSAATSSFGVNHSRPTGSAGSGGSRRSPCKCSETFSAATSPMSVERQPSRIARMRA